MKIIIPPYIDLARKKSKDRRVYLQFNCVGRLSGFLYNEAKKAVEEIILNQLTNVNIQIPSPCTVICRYYPSGKRHADIDNAFTVVKFCSDALVNAHLLIGDDFRYIKAVEYTLGGIDPINPRYEIQYIPYDENRYKFDDDTDEETDTNW